MFVSSIDYVNCSEFTLDHYEKENAYYYLKPILLTSTKQILHLQKQIQMPLTSVNFTPNYTSTDCRASAGEMAAAARGGEPDEKNIMEDGDWQTNP